MIGGGARAHRGLRWAGLLAGPLLAVAAHAALQVTYRTGAGEVAALTGSACATLAVTARMAT